jgi:hypothetical protein
VRTIVLLDSALCATVTAIMPYALYLLLRSLPGYARTRRELRNIVSSLYVFLGWSAAMQFVMLGVHLKYGPGPVSSTLSLATHSSRTLSGLFVLWVIAKAIVLANRRAVADEEQQHIEDARIQDIRETRAQVMRTGDLLRHTASD